MNLKTSHAPEIDERLLRSVLDKLQRWDAKNTGHQSEKRRGNRHGYENQSVVIIVPSADFDEDFAPPIADPAHVSFPVRARNLSRSGLSFLTPRDVLPRIITDDAVPIYIDEFLKLERLVFVGMEVIGKGNLWLKAKVARFRPSHDGLFECGLQFLAKTTGPQHE